MKVVVDRDKCQDNGQCAFASPEVFLVDPETSKLLVLQEEPDEAFRDQVEEAADACPVQAITIEE
jgi:ferredoxin